MSERGYLLYWTAILVLLLGCAVLLALADRAAVCVSSAFIETGHPMVVNPTTCN